MYTTRAFHLGTLGRENDDNCWFLTPQRDNTEKCFKKIISMYHGKPIQSM